MSSRVKLLFSKLKINRKLIIIIIILSLLGFILFSSIGGSITDPFGQREGNPIYQEDPQSVGLPNSDGNGFNLSDFGDPPSGLNPPAGAIGNLGDLIGNGGTPSIDPPQGSGGISPPGGSYPPIGGGNPPNPSGPIDFPSPPGGGGGASNPGNSGGSGSKGRNTSIGLPFKFPDRPDKAEFMYNLSEIELFPNTNFSIKISINLPQINLPDVQFNNLVMLAIIVASLYIPNMVISSLLAEASPKKKNTDDEEEDSVFFRPHKSEAELKREEERRKKLLSLADYLDEIIAKMDEQVEKGVNPATIINETYLELDHAFANFMGLKRERSLTPLEHAHQTFETHEIDNQYLNQIVELFYRSRFGNKTMTLDEVDQLRSYIQELVKRENIENSSRWRIF